MKIVKKLYPQANARRLEFRVNLQALMGNANNLLSKTIFFDEATFHVDRNVNRHNVRIWGSENPHATLEVLMVLQKLVIFLSRIGFVFVMPVCL